MSEALGIHQSDIIIRTALVKALSELRASPWLLDYCFASLPQDTLTAKKYGEKEVAEAKKWFLKTRIPVVMSPVLNPAQAPCINITLLDSSEAETTLADIHYQDTEDRSDTEKRWPILAGPFTPESYVVSTGVMKVPSSVFENLVLSAGQTVVTRQGRVYEIEEVLDESTLKLPDNSQGDFRDAVIRGQKPAQVLHLESVNYRESYSLGCHVVGEPVYLTWLHSIVVFALLRYKEELLEGRGFERTSFSSRDFRREGSWEQELEFNRYITITGHVRQVWVKKVSEKITSVETQAQIDGSENLPAEFDPDNSLWIGDQDTPLTS